VPFRIAAPPAGLHWGEIRLEGDGFAEDDRFYYALRTVTPVHVLLVDGDPGTSLFDSEIFYLLQALQPRGVLGRPLFYPKSIPWEGLEQERLSDYQVIALCNVEALTSQVRQRLYQFVVEGGASSFSLAIGSIQCAIMPCFTGLTRSCCRWHSVNQRNARRSSR
jgi:hypothetical protein